MTKVIFLLLLTGCVPVVPAQAMTPVVVADAVIEESSTNASREELRGQHEEAGPVVPAEPFSAAWVDEPDAEKNLGPDAPRYQRINSHACAEPLLDAQPEDGYQQLVEALFDVGRGGNVLASLRTHAYLDGPELLSLVRRPSGQYILRSVSIPRGKWYQLTTEVRDAAVLETTLAGVAAARVIREHPIDVTTAQLMRELWRAVLDRAQVVEEVNPTIFWVHPTGFIWDAGGQRAAASSPPDGSVLGDALQAAAHLRRVVAGTASDEAEELRDARSLMRDSLTRTRKKEPCLIHVDL